MLKLEYIEKYPENLSPIGLGEIKVDSEVLFTYLGSCVCVGFHSAKHKIGGISHITGFKGEGRYNFADEAIDGMLKAFLSLNIKKEELHCFVIGGHDNCKHLLYEVEEELKARNTKYHHFDVLGKYYRRIYFDPSTGTISLEKKPLKST